MEINTSNILEFTRKKFPTDSDKIRQTKAEQVITPKNPPKPSKNFSLYNYPGLRYDRCVNFGKEMYASMVNGYINANNKVYPLSRTFLSNRQTVTVTFPADNFLFPIGCMK